MAIIPVEHKAITYNWFTRWLQDKGHLADLKQEAQQTPDRKCLTKEWLTNSANLQYLYGINSDTQGVYIKNNISFNTDYANNQLVVEPDIDYKEPPATHTITVTCINVTSVPAATVTQFTVNDGDNFSIQFTPNDGYEWGTLNVSPLTHTAIETSGSVKTVNIENIQGDYTIRAEAVESVPPQPDTYTVRVNCGTGTTATTMSGTVEAGGTFTTTISVSDSCYGNLQYRINGGSWTTISDTSYRITIMNIQQNTTIDVQAENLCKCIDGVHFNSVTSPLRLTVGQTKTVGISWGPQNNNQDQTISFTSSNTSIATVTPNTVETEGLIGTTITITAVAVGNATINYICSSGAQGKCSQLSDSLSVIVAEDTPEVECADDLEFNISSDTLQVGETKTYTVSYTPGTEEQELTFSVAYGSGSVSIESSGNNVTVTALAAEETVRIQARLAASANCPAVTATLELEIPEPEGVKVIKAEGIDCLPICGELTTDLFLITDNGVDVTSQCSNINTERIDSQGQPTGWNVSFTYNGEDYSLTLGLCPYYSINNQSQDYLLWTSPQCTFINPGESIEFTVTPQNPDAAIDYINLEYQNGVSSVRKHTLYMMLEHNAITAAHSGTRITTSFNETEVASGVYVTYIDEKTIKIRVESVYSNVKISGFAYSRYTICEHMMVHFVDTEGNELQDAQDIGYLVYSPSTSYTTSNIPVEVYTPNKEITVNGVTYVINSMNITDCNLYIIYEDKNKINVRIIVNYTKTDKTTVTYNRELGFSQTPIRYTAATIVHMLPEISLLSSITRVSAGDTTLSGLYESGYSIYFGGEEGDQFNYVINYTTITFDVVQESSNYDSSCIGYWQPEYEINYPTGSDNGSIKVYAYSIQVTKYKDETPTAVTVSDSKVLISNVKASLSDSDASFTIYNVYDGEQLPSNYDNFCENLKYLVYWEKRDGSQQGQQICTSDGQCHDTDILPIHLQP